MYFWFKDFDSLPMKIRNLNKQTKKNPSNLS